MTDLGGYATLSVRLKAEGSKQFKDEARGAYVELNKLNDSMDKAEKNTKDLGTESKKTSGALKDQKTQTDRVKDSTNKLNKELTASSGRLKVIGRDINRYVTLPMLAFSAASIKVANDLNSGLGNVAALLVGTGDRIFELKEDVKELSMQTGRSFNDINEALYRTISVFQDTTETVDRLGIAVRMGIAGYATAADSVQLLSSVTRAFGDTSAQAVQRVADLSFETVRLGDTTIPALSAAMQVATDRADRLGVSQEELFAVFSTLTGITGDASMVATQFRSAMDSLLNPTDELTALLQNMGFASAEVALEQKGLVGVLSAIATEAERTGKPLQDFITRKEGMTLVSRLAGEQLGDYVFKLSELTDSSGAAADAFEQTTDTVAKFNTILNQNRQRILVSASEIGDELLPAFAGLVTTVADLLQAFTNLPDVLRNGIYGVTLLVSAMGALSMVMGVIKSLQLANVFVQLNKVMGITLFSVKALTISLGGMASILSVVAAAFMGYQFIQVRRQRDQQEAVEATNKVLLQQLNLLEDMETIAMRNRVSVQASSVQYAQQFRESGSIPVLSQTPISGPGASGDMINLSRIFQPMTGASGATSRINENTSQQVIKTQIQTYENLLKVYSEGRDKINAEIAKLVPQTQETANRLESILSGDEFVETLQRVFNRSTVGMDTADFLNQSMEDQLATLESRAMPFGQGSPLGAFVQEYMRLISQSVTQEIKMSDLKEMLQSTGGPEMESQLLGVLDVLNSYLTENVDSVTKTWQQWFAEITGIDFTKVRGRGGENVAQIYKEEMDKLFNFDVALSEAFGITPDTTQMIESRISDLISHVNDLFESNASSEGTDSPFTLVDKLFASDQGLFQQYKDNVSDLASSIANDFTTAWNQQSTSAERLNTLLAEAGIQVNDVALTYDDWESRLYDVAEAMEALQTRGLDSTQAGFENLQSILEMIVAEMEKLKEVAQKTLPELVKYADMPGVLENRLSESGGGLGERSFTQMMADYESGMVSSEFGEGLLARRDELLKDFDTPAWTTAHAEEVALLTERYEDLAVKAYHFSQMGEEFLTTTIDGISNSFWAMGEAMASGADMATVMAGTLANLAIELLRIIPMMMIQAGLEMVMTGNIPLGLGLIAMGTAGLLLGGFIQGTLNSSPTTETMASGGIINSPTRMGNVLAGEAGKEAIMPLSYTSDGNLGVHIAGGSTEPPMVNIEIKNYAGVEVEQEQNSDGSIAIILRKAVKGMIMDGTVDKEMRGRYGVQSLGRS